VNIEATVLYADLADSTDMVDANTSTFSAEVYKTFLHCSGKIIRSEGAEITAYDGDRIMAVFIGGQKNTSAVRAAMKINWAVKNIIQPALAKSIQPRLSRSSTSAGLISALCLSPRPAFEGQTIWSGSAARQTTPPSSHRFRTAPVPTSPRGSTTR